MVVVVGMARSGLAVSRLLQANGIPVFATDSDPAPSLAEQFDRASIEYEVGGHVRAPFADAEEIVVSPGVPLEIAPLSEARSRGQRVVSELEVASRYLRGDIVAITGSNGKTTTTLLVAHLLRAGARPIGVGGNIGTAASELVSSSNDETINILEVSSFQLDSVSRFRPHVAVLLNLTPDHLDRYMDFESYRRAKFRVFENQTAEDFAILNGDDPQLTRPPVSIAARRMAFSRKSPSNSAAWVEGDAVVVAGETVLPIDEIPLRGSHNIENVLAATLVGDVYEIEAESMAAAIKTFKGVAHRLESVTKIQGVEFVNDSKATNVASAVKAIEAFQGSIVLIAGGKDKGGAFEDLVDAMQGRVRQVITIGAAAERLEQAIDQVVPVRRATTMDEAVELAVRLSRPGEVVLLAPACASFDMYENYEERGADFKRAVQSRLGVSA